jgi:hypothetical protein
MTLALPRLTRGCTLCGVAMMIRPRAQLPFVVLAAVLWTSGARAQADDGGQIVDVPQGDEYSDTDPSALTDFRPALDPYGSWVDDPAYGTAWTPDPGQVGADFEPYDTAGQWGYVGNDYTWISDYAWGPVCFHYGRWVFAAGRWLWIPGRLYSGAWVDWRVGDDGMLGWAPVAPAYVWYGGSAFGFGFQSPEPWAFASFGDVFGTGLSGRITFGSASVAELGRSRPYVRAQAGSSNPIFAQAITHGPPPSTLGIDPSRIPRIVPGVAELRARQLARPSTAVALGARPPTPHVVRSRPPAQRYSPPSRGSGGGARGRR